MNRPTDIEDLVGDSSKARKQLGWSPKLDFKELVKMMIEYDINSVKNGISTLNTEVKGSIKSE